MFLQGETPDPSDNCSGNRYHYNCKYVRGHTFLRETYITVTPDRADFLDKQSSRFFDQLGQSLEILDKNLLKFKQKFHGPFHYLSDIH